MVQSITELAAQVTPVVERMHLMDAQPGESVGAICDVRRDRILDRVEEGGRLTVRQRHDDPVVGVEQVDDVGRLVRCIAHTLERMPWTQSVNVTPVPRPGVASCGWGAAVPTAYGAAMADDFDPTTVPIRDAATVMLVRDAESDSGVEVFVLRRTGNAAFGAGMYVFPGGRVDDADGVSAIEPFCHGLDDAEASRQLGLDAGGLAYWVAAIRECFEEAGILLADKRNGSALGIGDDDRHAVHDGELSMADLCKRDDLVLDVSTTQYVDHWITPVGERRRFDTRFFVTETPAGQDGLHDDKETIDSTWIRPEVALQMQVDGELMMMPPTIKNLTWLSEFATAAEAVDAGAAITDPVTIVPKAQFDESGKMIGVAMPGDPDYDDL